jgi:hypothetical protein
MEMKLISGNPNERMSPDRKIVWAMLLLGAVKILGLDAWIPTPEDFQSATNAVNHLNPQVQELANQLRKAKEAGNLWDSLFAMVAAIAPTLYVWLKKNKELKLIQLQMLQAAKVGEIQKGGV